MGDEFQPHRHETTRCSFCQKFYNFPKVLQSSQEQGNYMKISIERGALLRTLGHVQSVVERRNTIPILANAMLVAENDSLKIIASDMEIEAQETRSDERRVGKECVRKCSSRWSPLN